MSLDHCFAPDHLQAERALTDRACKQHAAARAWSPCLSEPVAPPRYEWPAFSIDRSAAAAKVAIAMQIDRLVAQAKDAMFWGARK